MLWNNHIIHVFPDNFISLKVIATSSSKKGDTSNHTFKIAKLSNGESIKVPLFIHVDNIIKVDTRSAQYISRIKD